MPARLRKLLMAVTAGLDKLQKFPIRHQVFAGLEILDLEPVPAVLVVPPERRPVARLADDRLAGGNVDERQPGDRVRLKNQDGVVSDPIAVRPTQAIRPDCVYMVHGFGHSSRMLKKAYRKGASDSQLITRYETDPLMGGTGMNVNFVTLEQEA